MKQHITKEQWQELNDEEMDTIRRFVGWNKSRLLNIGQMIEFLEDDFLSLHIDDDVFFVDTIDTSFYGEEPIIPLWEVVKFKLIKVK